MINNDSLVSIIVPIFNTEEYLDRCINSLIKQTYRNIEIILVDDGSTDQSSIICDKYGEADSRVRVIHKANGGLSDARNAGLEICQGEYISFVDSDDYVDYRFIDILISNLSEYNADLCCCGRIRVEGDRTIESMTLPSAMTFDKESFLSAMLYGQYADEAAWDKLYKREILDGIQFPVGEINEDIVAIPKAIEKCQTIVHCGKPLYYYVRTPNSITTSRYSVKQRVVYKHLIDLEKTLLLDYPSLDSAIKTYQATRLIGLIASSSKERKDYEADYILYFNKLDELYKDIVRDPSIPKYTKFKCFLIKIHAYNFLNYIKRQVFKRY